MCRVARGNLDLAFYEVELIAPQECASRPGRVHEACLVLLKGRPETPAIVGKGVPDQLRKINFVMVPAIIGESTAEMLGECDLDRDGLDEYGGSFVLMTLARKSS